jgi:small neutral amino acid transporter SnatA (MarC family)
MISGPGAITTTIVLMNEAGGQIDFALVIFASIIVTILLSGS